LVGNPWYRAGSRSAGARRVGEPLPWQHSKIHTNAALLQKDALKNKSSKHKILTQNNEFFYVMLFVLLGLLRGRFFAP